MLIILSLFIVCSFFAWAIETSKTQVHRDCFSLICMFILVLVSGTHLVGGTDYFVYEDLYSTTPKFPEVLNPNLRSDDYEIGYIYISSFFKTLGISFYGFCLIHSAIFYFCLWKGMKHFTNHFGIVIWIFLYKLFFYNTMVSMRQSLTVAFFLTMVPYIEQKKYIKYYISALLVSTIHNGAYLLFALYPLAYVFLTKKRIIWLNIIFVPTFILGLVGIDLFEPIGQYMLNNAASDQMDIRAQRYFDNENVTSIGIFHTLEYFLLMTIVIINLRYFNLKNSKVNIAMLMFLCLLPLFTLMRGNEILTREKDYFTIYYAVLIGYLIDYLPQYRKVIYICIFLLCAFGYYRFCFLFDEGSFLGYRSWLLERGYSFFL